MNTEEMVGFFGEEIRTSQKKIACLMKEMENISLKLKKQEREVMILNELLKKVEDKTETLRSINEIMGCSLALDDTLEFIMDHVLKISESEAGSLLLVDETAGDLEFRIAKGEKKEEVKKLRLKIGEGICGWVAQKGKSLIANDLLHEERFRRDIPEKIGFETRNILCVPIKAKEKVIGVIEVLNKKRGEDYTEYDEVLLSSLSNQIAVVIENARLFEKTERKIEELSSLMKVSKVVSSTLDLKKLLRIVMDLAREVMDAEASSLMLLDEKGKELVFEVALGEKGNEVREYRVPVGRGIAGWVAEHGEPLLIPDVSKDERFFPDLDKKTRFKTRNILCVPLWRKEKVIGVIQVINALHRECFSQDDVRFFEAMGREVAVAIENARLFSDLENLFFDTIKSLAQAIDARDPYTRGHSERVARFSQIIADEMNLPSDEKDILRDASLLHDIGKIGVRDGVLLKPSRLTEEEFRQIKLHPTIGSDIVGAIRHLQHIVPGVRTHHERIDGNGYPDRLSGEDISLYGRIISVADAFDAMTSDRPYRRALTKEEALKRMKENTNTQFDPEVVKAFVSAYEKGLILTEREENECSGNSF